ncbi:NAD-binding protein [Lentinula aff. lateritia]|uniref:NAD-binding protein n=1 Tax=Lentinula aff. lateritia TaxID=2804960 RepID=A0ACC1TS70_9AGAR|nr:NAD-binding protein [Lentinula aff. lateritia]
MIFKSPPRGATRVALITGAAQGIGKAIALRLASDGYKIALNDVDSKRNQLGGLTDEIERNHGRETKERDVQDMVEAVSQRLGSLDVMVANAGILRQVPFTRYEPPLNSSLLAAEKQWDDVLRINTKGVFFCYKYAAKQWSRKAGLEGESSERRHLLGSLTYIGAYAASKFAIRGLTQVAALELGHHGITVNAYAPGAIKTPLLASAIDLSTIPTGEDFLNRLPPFSTVGKPEDVANLVSFLAFHESGYITGEPYLTHLRGAE